MALKLIYITNRPEVAGIAERSGVDWIFVDLEIRGKAARQGYRDTVLSCHSITDVQQIRQVLTRSELLVRVNPFYEGSEEEIEQVISAGADIVMLPYYKSNAEVETFIDSVRGRSKTCLLLETPEAADILEKTLNLQSIDSIHIGLNDLHLAYGMHFMFELLADGTVEKLCRRIAEKQIPYGFGGIARIGEKVPPAEEIIAEHYRLGSTMVILSRSFCDSSQINDLDQLEEIFKTGVAQIRAVEKSLEKRDERFFEANRISVRDQIREVAQAVKNGKVYK